MTPRNCVNAVLDALVTAAPPSPAFEESIAALRVRFHHIDTNFSKLFLHRIVWRSFLHH
jgi:hypothetical protein